MPDKKIHTVNQYLKHFVFKAIEGTQEQKTDPENENSEKAKEIFLDLLKSLQKEIGE